MSHRPLAQEHREPPPPKRRQKTCQAPHSVQKPSMSRHPDKIKNPAKMHLSYAPFAILNVVELNREDPATTPGLSPLRTLPEYGVGGPRFASPNLVNSGGTPLVLTICICNQTQGHPWEKFDAAPLSFVLLVSCQLKAHS
jgi:hypothetical protein